MKNHKLELIVFICGAVVMILELTGSRILAPYLGTSLFVWTSLIGIILGSLSLGYFWGGKLADKKANFQQFSLIIFLAAVLVALTSFSKEIILQFLEKNVSDIRISSVIATILLFAPASIFLGMVSPYAIKLKLDSLQKSGRTVGNLYAISTIGSIVGTFLAGFFLVAFFGNGRLLVILAITLLLTSILAFTSRPNIKLILIALFVGYLSTTYIPINSNAYFVDVDTNYNRVQIYEDVHNETGKPIRILDIATTANSAMFLDSDDLVFEYTKFYDLASLFNPAFEKTLILGGGAYSYPKYFLKKYPQATIDVVEIDEKLTELAKEHFNLKEDPRMKIHHEDGRIFLNKTKEKYDVIFGDAYNSYYSIPYQLTTVEAAQKIHDSLNDDGIILLNVISSLEGETSKFLKAEYKTFKEVFPQIYVYPVKYPENPDVVQNIILVALKSEEIPSFIGGDDVPTEFMSGEVALFKYLDYEYTKEITSDLPILTDDFAPVDQYTLEFFAN